MKAISFFVLCAAGMAFANTAAAQTQVVPAQPTTAQTLTYEAQVLQQLEQINNTLKSIQSAEVYKQSATAPAPTDTKDACIFFDHAYSEGSETNGLTCVRSGGHVHWAHSN